MTFEEAIELIEDECRVEAEDGFFTNERNLDAFFALYIIKNLKETYAPKIKMTFEQKSKLMIFIYEGELYKEFSKKELMQAWLHPELIEVTDD